MVPGEVEGSCQLVATFFFFFFFGLTLPNYKNKSGCQPSPPSYQLLPPPLAVDNAPRQSYRGGNFFLLSHYHSSSFRSSLPGHHQLLSKH